LPEKMDRNRISALVSDTYLRFWSDRSTVAMRTS
jgi:hypothetical protein